jgi:hypothetical protein
MRCSHCGSERLKNIKVQGESCTCKHCGAEFTVQTSADRDRAAVVFCSRLPKPGRGGARKGTGPKLGPGGKKIDRNTALTADVWAFHSQNDESPGKSIEAMTRRSAAFRAWKGDRDKNLPEAC